MMVVMATYRRGKKKGETRIRKTKFGVGRGLTKVSSSVFIWCDLLFFFP